MPAKAKKKKREGLSWFLPVLALVLLGGIWTAEQFSRSAASPAWLSAFFAPGSSSSPRVGLIAGHLGNDSGAVCPDGLTEASINKDVADRTAELLRAKAITVDVLEEYDARLQGYQADALVSIHSDSCSVDYSGFKVANKPGAGDAAERLTACLWDKYEARTGLPRHPQTVTQNMTGYHAFNRIAADTPAAIIELGFMDADRALLTEQAGVVAQGVADGILCFFEPEPVK